jgi:hypothetical protein
MSTIMCAPPLLRRLGHTPLGRWVGDRPLPAVRLGSWGAKILADDDREIVLAVDQRTQLAVVFPLEPTEQFRPRFIGALRAMLEELGVPADAVTAETSAIAAAPLAPLADAALRKSLRTLHYVGELELMYHDDLQTVQSNLNDFPHPPAPYVPKLAVAQLFGLTEVNLSPDRPLR